MNVFKFVFSAKSVGRRTIEVRVLGKVLQVSEMLVPDRRRVLQMSIISSAGHNDDILILKDRNANLWNFPLLTTWLRVGLVGVAYRLPSRVGEASGSLKILRNCLFSTPQTFLSYLLCFSHVHILGGRRKVFFCNLSIQNKHSVVCRGFLLDGKILYLEPKYKWKGISIKKTRPMVKREIMAEAMISSLGLQEGLNQRSSDVFLNTCKPKPRYGTLRPC